MAKAIFAFNGINTTIQCLLGDKMKDVCLKYSSKIDIDINSLYFLYGGNKLNLNFTFEQVANSIDKNKKEMVILVYQLEKEGFICPKCGERVRLDTKLIENICLSNTDINDILIGIQGQIENIINDILNKKSINYINNQLKNINIIISNALGEIKKNNEKLNQLKNINNKSNDIVMKNSKNNIIEGVLDIKVNDIKNGVILFNKKNKDGINVYLNDIKINMINEDNKWKIDYNFKKDGKYKFKIIFNNNIKSFHRFFQDCSNLYSIDLSNFDSKNVTDISYMFNLCHKLKEIKGMKTFNTSNVNNMRAMFQDCCELEFLDLSNFDTSIVMDMSYMFKLCQKYKVTNMWNMFGDCKELEYLDLSNFETPIVMDMKFMFYNCNKLKEINGIHTFKTNKVFYMTSMFGNCYELENLDLSNFDTSNTEDMSYIFSQCYKLREIKGINKFNTSNVVNMRAMFQCCYELKYLDLSNFDTSNTSDLSYMFCQCNKLKYLNISKFKPYDNTENIFLFDTNNECEFIAENETFVALFNSSNN